MKFNNDYDHFEVGEVHYLQKDEEFYIDDETEKLFEEDTEVEILEITKETGYGEATILIDGHKLTVSLDELYDMVFE